MYDIYENITDVIRDFLSEGKEAIMEATNVDDWWDKLPGKRRVKVGNFLGLNKNSTKKIFSKLSVGERSEVEAYFTKHKGKVEHAEIMEMVTEGKDIPTKDDVVKFLRAEEGRTVTVQILRSALGVGQHKITRLLTNLVKEGVLAKDDPSKYKTKATHYKLAESYSDKNKQPIEKITADSIQTEDKSLSGKIYSALYERVMGNDERKTIGG